MTARGRTLQGLHLVSAILMLALIATGYGHMLGLVGPEVHIPSGFFIALGVSFTHAMTMFYFVGLGVSMRAEARGHSWCAPYLAKAARFRARLAPLIGVAIVTLMAATILGGGSHTRTLPFWAHHGFGAAALVFNMLASWKSILLVGRQEELVSRMEGRLPGDRFSGARAGRPTTPPVP